MGANVQVCWEKFANYWDVEARLVPMRDEVFHLTGEEATGRCDENTVGVVAVLGSAFDGSDEPVADICAALDRLQRVQGHPRPRRRSLRCHRRPLLRPGAGMGLHPARVALIKTSGHKYGRADAHLRADLLAPRVPGRRPVNNFLRFGRDGYRRVQHHCRDVVRSLDDRIAALGPFRLITDGRQLPVFAFTLADSEERYSVFDVSAALREQGWLVRAYPFPADREDLAVLRVVVRNGFSHDLADLLMEALRGALPRLRGQTERQRGPESASFSHQGRVAHAQREPGRPTAR